VLELDAGVLGGALPVDRAVPGITPLLPDCDPSLELLEALHPAVQAPAAHYQLLDLRDAELATVLGRVVYLLLICERLGLLWRERFIERSGSVSVSIPRFSGHLKVGYIGVTPVPWTVALYAALAPMIALLSYSAGLR
jgi:hypothetical protein